MIKSLKIGNKEFQIGEKTYIMGILNVTPDSFSDGGSFNQIEAALKHTEDLIKEGTHIIDIGGESTRPDYTMVSVEQEIERVAPVIESIKKNFDVPVSIDTYKSGVAKAAILAGADMVNDIWGLKYDTHMAEVIQKYDVPVCIMHNRPNMDYSNFMEDAIADLKESIDIAKKSNVDLNKIMIDPGIGFAKTYEMNVEMLGRMEELFCFDMPILLGTSRKSVIGMTLDLPVTEREEGTIATSVIGVMKGCHFLRVHNVKGNIRAVKMAEAIKYWNK